MSQPWIFILAVVAGGLGALSRWWLGALVNNHVRTSMRWGTFVVNVLACFLDGLLAGLVAHFLAAWTGMAVLDSIIGTGFLGGFSTFSTASVEGFQNFRAGAGRGLLYVGGMLVLSIGLCFAGYFLGLC
ncbi:MAG: CrcB family protein [Aeriscardovia sp.]|nr:CrcB family protein [Aeriscardovia sp.]